MSLEMTFKETAILQVRQGFREYLSKGEGFAEEIFFMELPGLRGSLCRIMRASYEWQPFSEEWGIVKGNLLLEKKEHDEKKEIKTCFSILCQKKRTVTVRYIHHSKCEEAESTCW